MTPDQTTDPQNQPSPTEQTPAAPPEPSSDQSAAPAAAEQPVTPVAMPEQPAAPVDGASAAGPQPEATDDVPPSPPPAGQVYSAGDFGAPAKPSGSGKKRLFGLIGVLILLALILGALFIFVFKKDKKADTGNTPATSTTEQSNATAQSDDVSAKIDINALATSLEVYYTDHGSYPTLSELKDEAFVSENLPGLQIDNLSEKLDSTVSKTTYGYQPEAENGKPCDDQTACVKFTLGTTLSDGTVYQKLSLNQ